MIRHSARLALAAALMLAASNLFGAISYVQSKVIDSGTVTSGSLAFTANNTASNAIIVAVRIGGTGRTVTVTDSRGNTYVQRKNQVQGTDHELFVIDALNIAAGANTVSVSVSGAATTLRFAIHEYQGLAQSGAFDQASSAQSSSAGTALNSGSVTTTKNNALLFGVGTTPNPYTFTAGTSYTLRESTGGDKIATEDRIVSSTGTYAATETISAADNWAAAIVVYTPTVVTITSGLAANNKVYDGTNSATINSNNVVLSGVLPGDVGNVSLSTNGYTASFASATEGNGKTVTVSGLTLTGSAAGNYTLTQPTLSANITASADVATTKSGSTNMFFGTNLTYTIAVTNSGPSTASNIVVSDTLPAGVTFAGASGGGTLPAGLAIDRASSNNVSTALSWTHVTTNAANRLMLVGVTVKNAGAAVSAITYGSSNLTKIKALNAGAVFDSEVWMLVDPPAGTNTVTITRSAGAVYAGAVTFSGVDPTKPVSATNFATAASTSASVTVNSATNEIVFANVACDNLPPTSPGAGQTLWWALGTGEGGAASTKAGASPSATMTWTAGNPWAMIAVSVKPASGGNQVTWAIPSMASGATTNFTVTVTPAGVGTLTNSASSTASTSDPNSANNAGSAAAAQVITVVNKGDQNITFPSPGNQTYGVAPVSLGATASSALAVSYSVTSGPASIAGNTLTITGAGSVTIQASQAGDANWNAATPVSQTISVAQKSVTVSSGLTANNKVYDATTTATISSNNVSLSGVLAGDSANVALATNSYTASFATAAVGTGKAVTLSGLTLTGSAAANYTLTQPTLTANITVATVTVSSGLTANNKVYDATTTATISSNNVSLSGVIAGDTANVKLSTNGYSATFASAAVGSGKAVTVGGLTLTGSSAGNYTLTQPSLSANITAVTVTISSGLTANNKVYDATTTATISSNNVSLSGVIAGDVANVKLSTNGYTATFASAGVGSGINVTLSGLTLTGSAAANYTLTQPTLTANITVATVTVSSGLTANNKVYDGATTATISSNNVSLSGVIAGDAANVALVTNGYTAGFATATVGTAKAVTVSGLTLTGSAAANYSLTQPSLSANITVATVTVSSGLTANNKVYDATTAATISSNNVSLSGVIAGDVANVKLSTNGYTASFATAAVGTGKAVTVSGLTLTGSAAGNYTLTQPAGLTANITPGAVARLAVTVQPGSASAGSAFGQQPVVVAQDSFGNPSTVGLPASLNVIVTLTTGTGPLQGTTTLDIGTGAGNGTVSFSGLRIDAAGTKQLTVSASGLTPALSASFTVANVAPVAGTASLQRPRNVPLKIPIATLMSSASDLNGDALTFVGVSATSTNGATIFTNATYVLYSVPPGGNVTDRFTYTVSDGTTAASGTVVITPQSDPTGITFNIVAYGLVGGKPTMTVAGIPGRSYTVQRTQDLGGSPVWSDLFTTNAPAGGLFQFVDQTPPGGSVFYRASNN